MYYDNTTLINPKSTSIDVNRRWSTPDRRPVDLGRSRSRPNVNLRRFNPELGRFNVEHEVDVNWCKSTIDAVRSDRVRLKRRFIIDRASIHVEQASNDVERRRPCHSDVVWCALHLGHIWSTWIDANRRPIDAIWRPVKIAFLIGVDRVLICVDLHWSN